MAIQKSHSRPSASTIITHADKRDMTPDHAATPEELIFNRQTLLWIGGGILLMVLGMLLMAGGQMPDPGTWDPDLIYSFRRITLAPIVILTGLVVIGYAIIKK